ncbi:hypothetical protein KXD40_000945 [Peronospora effusa]|nr:hypothetical protein KXD40_000945 [Peronospora effusa]
MYAKAFVVEYWAKLISFQHQALFTVSSQPSGGSCLTIKCTLQNAAEMFSRASFNPVFTDPACKSAQRQALARFHLNV